ncbi:hypothetical protein N180_00790 [Pedobacter antarcticus 4BY]|uniref:DUF5074 domain-containing protein n=2 Tax=Pedobacter antarcticus TaxID=34086 RepID=A0A081PBY2_9SPHI|nr:DUF5074 domain-containing protein [Pedobacter antarcticus]KEQ28205.1 hypothetical protein N180_00790 [Pedobacter antarcticus 4BY]SFE45285.1 protein of unknown function [Pedobacter antarcticus]
MKQFNIRQLLFAALIVTTSLYSCKKDNVDSPEIDPSGAKYDNGFFVIGEGSYARNAGAINFYRYGDDTLSIRAYEKENPGKILANNSQSSTLQFASVINNSIYLISKMNGPIVKVSASTLKEEARYVQETSNWRSIIQVDGNRGLLSAGDGVYQIDLNNLAIQNKLINVSAVNTGDMLKNGDYVYVLQSNGAKILSASNYSFVKSFSNLSRGFAETPNGKVWASTGSRLIAIDSKLDTVGVAIPVSLGSSGLDAPTRITASTKENAVFYHSGKSIYKYIDGNASTLAKPFITITEDPFMVYGAIRYDRNKDYIVVNGIQGYGAASTVNYLLIYNASTGALVKKIKYGGDGVTVDFSKIFFPDLTVFH